MSQRCCLDELDKEKSDLGDDKKLNGKPVTGVRINDALTKTRPKTIPRR
jgi:hypothetical protein